MKHENKHLAVKLRHELHQHPELSNQELWTKQHVIDFLKTHTSLEIVDRGLWFYAIYHSPVGRRNVAFRADFDAILMDEVIDLPYGSQCDGVSHKCGHDGHTASLAGLALEIDQTGCDNNVYFLFQHAEETGDGAAQCTVFLEECGIDEIFAEHNLSGFEKDAVYIPSEVANCASKGVSICFTGAPSHASQPELGRNPSFAIAHVIDGIPGFVDPEKNQGMVLCTIVQVDVGEKAFGVNASKGVLRLTIRALYEHEMDRLQQNLEDLARAEAEKHGLTVSFEFQDEFPETRNHRESVEKIYQVCRTLGLKAVEMEPMRGSEDFGHYLKKVKGAICYLGNGTNYASLHSFEYDYPDDQIPLVVELFKGLAAL